MANSLVLSERTNHLWVGPYQSTYLSQRDIVGQTIHQSQKEIDGQLTEMWELNTPLSLCVCADPEKGSYFEIFK